MMTESFKVILVDDDREVLRTLKIVFESAGFQATCYDNAREFLDAIPDDENAAILLDLRMPHVSGFEVLAGLKQADCSLPIIVYSSHADVEATVKVFEEGAFTLIQKPASKNLLIEKVKVAILNNRESKRRKSMTREARQRLANLSEREKQIMELLVEGKSAREIGEQVHLSARTVETHRGNIFNKADVRSSAELARLLTLSELK